MHESRLLAGGTVASVETLRPTPVRVYTAKRRSVRQGKINDVFDGTAVAGACERPTAWLFCFFAHPTFVEQGNNYRTEAKGARSL